jgi:type IV secretory pathway TrbL component
MRRKVTLAQWLSATDVLLSTLIALWAVAATIFVGFLTPLFILFGAGPLVQHPAHIAFWVFLLASLCLLALRVVLGALVRACARESACSIQRLNDDREDHR